MTRSYNVVEINKFNAGLITDASPLTAPDNSSLEENNFVLNIDGSRNRRLGMDYELGYNLINTNISTIINTAITNYRWDNAAGIPDKSIAVVQVGNEIKFFNLDSEVLSQGLITTSTFSSELVETPFSYAVVDGLLIVATTEKSIYIFECSEDNVITRRSTRLNIRDLFGVEDVIGGVDISRGTDVQTRPYDSVSTHIYNLRNQSWGIPRIDGSDKGGFSGIGVVGEITTPSSTDPIATFRTFSGGRFPANSDTVVEALYPDAENESNRTIDRFFAEDLFRNPLGTGRAALGYYIIDALDRGISRKQEDDKNRGRYPELNSYPVPSLPQDITPAGAKTVAEFAGRVFYAGFPGTVINGDRHSPKMSSYVLFSKVVDSAADINMCYQEGDPTSKEAPDIVDTDGGFIRINEAYDIKKLINLGSSLMVVAANGVWRITGGSDKGFTATSYIVEKITDRGCISQNSILQIDNTFMFWGKDGIYHVATDQFGSWVCNNISFGRIQKFYDAIPVDSKIYCKGEYDSYERKVRWIYNNRVDNEDQNKELVLDVQLQAFYVNTINQVGDYPKVVSMFIGKPYLVSAQDIPVVVNSDPVVVNTDPVVVENNLILNVSQRELGYIVVTGISPTLQYTFASYRNEAFRDWFSVDGVGIDAEAFLVTNYLSGTDFQRDKQVPYATVHLRRTETGFSDDGNMIPENQSSCLIQSRWDWSNSDRSGKWGREFQAYRYRRLHLPQDSSDDYDNGFSTIVTRNKIRGNGRVLSLRFRTEPYKDLHLYGWSMILSVAENV